MERKNKMDADSGKDELVGIGEKEEVNEKNGMAQVYEMEKGERVDGMKKMIEKEFYKTCAFFNAKKKATKLARNQGCW